jgi:hypothetical protein
MATDRSQSRGREGYVSSGRGGIGNIRMSSTSRDARPSNGPDDFSEPRGREPKVDHVKAFSTGRGGAGNIRSPSRDVPTKSGLTAVEQEVIKTHIIADQTAVHSTGRGGLGNISRSRSRTSDSSFGSSIHSRDNPIHSTTDDKELAKKLLHEHGDAIHSTGRGGAGNIPHQHVSDVEPVHHAHHHRGAYESNGRGGAGNIIVEE